MCKRQHLMRVLIADKFEQSGRDGLQAIGCEVSYQPDLKDESLVAAIKDQSPDVLVVRGTKVTEPMLDAGPVKLIVRAGAGYNTIDVAGASKRGIYVSNCPGKNAVAVAELAFALILALDRRLPDNVAELRAGKWNKKEFSKAQGLYGRTLGLLGIGSIGQEMVKRAAGMGLNVVLWSRRFDGERRALYPREPNDGTWLGVNDSGLCLALINWHRIKREPEGKLESRGRIIPRLIGASSGTRGRPRPSANEAQPSSSISTHLNRFAPAHDDGVAVGHDRAHQTQPSLADPPLVFLGLRRNRGRKPT